MILEMDYYFKGSINAYLKLVETPSGIVLITSYGETITTVNTGYDLMVVLEDLCDDKYA